MSPRPATAPPPRRNHVRFIGDSRYLIYLRGRCVLDAQQRFDGTVRATLFPKLAVALEQRLPCLNSGAAVGQQPTAFRDERIVVIERCHVECRVQRTDCRRGAHDWQAYTYRVEKLHPHAAAGPDRRDHRTARMKKRLEVIDEPEVANSVGIASIWRPRFLGADHA